MKSIYTPECALLAMTTNCLGANRFIFDHDEPGAELDTDRQIVIRPEALIGELQQQTRFANGGITDNDVPLKSCTSVQDQCSCAGSIAGSTANCTEKVLKQIPTCSINAFPYDLD